LVSKIPSNVFLNSYSGRLFVSCDLGQARFPNSAKVPLCGTLAPLGKTRRVTTGVTDM